MTPETFSPSEIKIGDQIAFWFWMYDRGILVKRYSAGTVMDIDFATNNEELCFILAEMPDTNILSHQVERITKKRQTLEELHRKTSEILTSKHLEAVEVSFEYEAASVRYYSAITKDSGSQHKYTVKVWEENGVTKVNCICAWGSRDRFAPCRHALKVSAADAKKHKRVLHLPTFASYKAWKNFQRPRKVIL